MKIQVSFAFRKGQIEAFLKVIPPSKRSRILRQFILNQYTLPVVIENLLINLDESTLEVYSFHLDELSLERLDGLVLELNKKAGIKANRSMIARDILEQITNKYSGLSLSPCASVKKLFHVPIGTKESLAKYISERDRTATYDDFILNEYSGPSLPAKELKKKPKGGSETMMLSLDTESIETLDSIANDYEVKRAHILRDVTTQLLDELKKRNPLKRNLEYKFKKTLDELKQHVSPEEIREFLSLYQMHENESLNKKENN